MVARARFVEDFVKRRAAEGVGQYVILGAGLDTFVQRYPGAGERLTVFEVDRPDTQAWKRKRLADCGFQIPRWQRLVPVDSNGWPRQYANPRWIPVDARTRRTGRRVR
ncbi:Putative S-adenosyl-L-methionine-dependent methyltransferase ML2640 [Mycobacteroides abscessus subsp. abscessus]|nr:Putative S-adenosyl-L-methionine-dependent methyltransferase ML2640 [Mycobacteroides abscessus subsp. abscessus]